MLLQRILDRDPSYLNGLAAEEVAGLGEQLYERRAEQLRQEARNARRLGEYGLESGALQALIELGRSDAWAEEYLPIAEVNCKFLDLYAVVQELVQAGDLDEARAKISRLWRDAPYYGDPAGIAPILGLSVPPSYEECRESDGVKERKAEAISQAHERKNTAFGTATHRGHTDEKRTQERDTRDRAKAEAELQRALAVEEEYYRAATIALRSTGKSAEHVRQALQGAGYPLYRSSNGQDAAGAMESIYRYQSQIRRAERKLYDAEGDVSDQGWHDLRVGHETEKADPPVWALIYAPVCVFIFILIIQSWLVVATGDQADVGILRYVLSLFNTSSSQLDAGTAAIFTGCCGCPAAIILAVGAATMLSIPALTRRSIARIRVKRLAPTNVRLRAKMEDWQTRQTALITSVYNARVKQLRDEHRDHLISLDQRLTSQQCQIRERLDQERDEVVAICERWEVDIQRIAEQWLRQAHRVFEQTQVPIGDPELQHLSEISNQHQAEFAALANRYDQSLEEIAHHYESRV